MPQYRAARPADADDLASVIRAAYAPFAARIPDLPDVAAGLDDDIHFNDVWIAEADGKLVGGVVIAHAATGAHLVNLAVHPDAAGQGVGRALVNIAMERARQRGAATLDLATHVLMPENVSLYARLGWQETGRQGNKVLMRRTL